MEKELRATLRTPDNNKFSWAFKSFGIDDQDIALGLRHVKAKVRSEFKSLAKQYHPDTNCRCVRARKFMELNRLRKKVQAMQVMPISVDNLEIVLEITKGYKSTNEYELPFNEIL